MGESKKVPEVIQILIKKGLTPRQADVSYQVYQGKRNKDIAASMFVTEQTVKYHLTACFKIFKVKSRLEVSKIVRETVDNLKYDL